MTVVLNTSPLELFNLTNQPEGEPGQDVPAKEMSFSELMDAYTHDQDSPDSNQLRSNDDLTDSSPATVVDLETHPPLRHSTPAAEIEILAGADAELPTSPNSLHADLEQASANKTEFGSVVPTTSRPNALISSTENTDLLSGPETSRSNSASAELTPPVRANAPLSIHTSEGGRSTEIDIKSLSKQVAPPDTTQADVILRPSTNLGVVSQTTNSEQPAPSPAAQVSIGSKFTAPSNTFQTNEAEIAQLPTPTSSGSIEGRITSPQPITVAAARPLDVISQHPPDSAARVLTDVNPSLPKTAPNENGQTKVEVLKDNTMKPAKNVGNVTAGLENSLRNQQSASSVSSSMPTEARPLESAIVKTVKLESHGTHIQSNSTSNSFVKTSENNDVIPVREPATQKPVIEQNFQRLTNTNLASDTSNQKPLMAIAARTPDIRAAVESIQRDVPTPSSVQSALVTNTDLSVETLVGNNPSTQDIDRQENVELKVPSRDQHISVPVSEMIGNSEKFELSQNGTKTTPVTNVPGLEALKSISVEAPALFSVSPSLAEAATKNPITTSSLPNKYTQPSQPAALQAVAQNLVHAYMSQSGVSIRLDPPEMGNVMINFQFDAERGVTAIIRSELVETSVFLKERAEILQQALKDSGFDTINLSFENGAATSQDDRTDHQVFGKSNFIETEDETLMVHSANPLSIQRNKSSVYTDQIDLRL